MSIATQISALQTDKTNIASAITTKGGTVNSGDGFDNFASDILTIPTGGGGQTQTKSLSVTQNGSYTVLPDTGYTLSQVDVSVNVAGAPIQPKDVTFYDWDGTVLYSYTFAEIQQLSALPALPPAYKDYTADSWTETLQDLQASNVPRNVGVNYTTTRTETKFYITVDDLRKEDVCLYNPSKSNGSWTVNWGDGSSTVVTRGSTRHHTYALAGDYVVTATPGSSLTNKVALRAYFTDSGSKPFTSGGVIYSSYDMPNDKTEAGMAKNFKNHILMGVEPGSGSKFVISDYGLIGAYNVKAMIVPKSTVIDRWGYAYSGFEFVSFPSTMTLGATNYRFCFQNMKKLKRVVLPTAFDSSTYIVGWIPWNGQTLFGNCQNLVEYLPLSTASGSGYNIANSTFVGSITTDTTAQTETISLPASLNLERLNVPEGIFTTYNMLGTWGITVPYIGYTATYDRFMPLKELHLPSTLQNITKEDFSFFSELKEIRFPSSVANLQDVVLPKISHFESTTPPSLSNVTGPEAQHIYVPASAVTDYQTAWTDFASIIESEPTI